ncbi:pilus assembly protein TadG-related protein [Kocuria sp. CPCC 205263]|uniref:pilus assembly protein TadG-related protein n=1 Tax=Kocuria sp. CPCC 205263 TaxID=3073555 RepID=UPI0034D3BCBE
MRWLIDFLERAQVRHRADGERGAIAVTTALTLVVLLGFAAIAIDFGLMYEEKAQLQNGADSAALAVAQNCVEAPSTCSSAAPHISNKIALDNTRDGLSDVASLTFPTSTSVRVQTQANDGKAGAGKLALSIAPVLGVKDPSISAAASASWGGPGTGPATLPIAVSHCQATKAFEQSGSTVVLDITGKSNLPGCTHEGSSVPGGFGWFRQGAKAECGQETSHDDIVFSDPGNDFAESCDDVLKGLLHKSIGDVLLLPVYDSTSDSGNNGKYYISGWIAFKVTGWNFGGSAKDDNNVNVREHANQGLCTGNCRGIIGTFVRYASLDELYTDDGPLTYGAAIVKLSD